MPLPKSAADCPEGFSLAIRNPQLGPGVIFNAEHPQMGEQVNPGDLVCIPDDELRQHAEVDAAGGIAAWLPAPASAGAAAAAAEGEAAAAVPAPEVAAVPPPDAGAPPAVPAAAAAPAPAAPAAPE